MKMKMWLHITKCGLMQCNLVFQSVMKQLESQSSSIFHPEKDHFSMKITILYANQGNHYAWVSNDSYHLKPKGEGTSIMVSGVSVACHGWLHLKTVEPKLESLQHHAK